MDAPPEFTIDAATEFKPYFDKLEKTSQGVSGQALELLVLSWLTEIARTGDARSKKDPSRPWRDEPCVDDGVCRVEPVLEQALQPELSDSCDAIVNLATLSRD